MPDCAKHLVGIIPFNFAATLRRESIIRVLQKRKLMLSILPKVIHPRSVDRVEPVL